MMGFRKDVYGDVGPAGLQSVRIAQSGFRTCEVVLAADQHEDRRARSHGATRLNGSRRRDGYMRCKSFMTASTERQVHGHIKSGSSAPGYAQNGDSVRIRVSSSGQKVPAGQKVPVHLSGGQPALVVRALFQAAGA